VHRVLVHIHYGLWQLCAIQIYVLLTYTDVRMYQDTDHIVHSSSSVHSFTTYNM